MVHAFGWWAALGGRKILDVTFGNRFRGVFRLPEAAKPWMEFTARRLIRP